MAASPAAFVCRSSSHQRLPSHVLMDVAVLWPHPRSRRTRLWDPECATPSTRGCRSPCCDLLVKTGGPVSWVHRHFPRDARINSNLVSQRASALSSQPGEGPLRPIMHGTDPIACAHGTFPADWLHAYSSCTASHSTNQHWREEPDAGQAHAPTDSWLMTAVGAAAPIPPAVAWTRV